MLPNQACQGDCRHMEREVGELRDMRLKFETVVRQTKLKDSQSQALLRENDSIRQELERSRAAEQLSKAHGKSLQGIICDQEKLIREKKDSETVVRHLRKEINELEEHYMREVVELERLLQRQSAVIKRLEVQIQNCPQCEEKQLRLTEMGGKIKRLEAEVGRLGREDAMRVDLEQMKNKLSQVKRLELDKIDRLFEQIS